MMEAVTDGTTNSYFNIISIMENIRCNRTYIYSDFSSAVYTCNVDSFPNDRYVHLGTNCNILFYRTGQLQTCEITKTGDTTIKLCHLFLGYS